jgi:anti-sigma factor RsiW
MTCDRILELLSDYIDGELSSASNLGVQSHLKRCAQCEYEHQALRRTVQLVALFGRQEVPIDCREAVMARLRESPRPVVRSPWASLADLFSPRVPMLPAWARATALAGLAVASVSAGTLLMQREPDVTPPRPPVTLALQEDRARVRDASQLLQALGRDDGYYILAADFADGNR